MSRIGRTELLTRLAEILNSISFANRVSDIGCGFALDDFGAGYLKSDSILLIKIDTQGFEHEVLKGSQEMLKKAVGLHLELSLAPLYGGQIQFDEMIAELKSLGFHLWSIEPGFADLRSGRLYQADAVFFRF